MDSHASLPLSSSAYKLYVIMQKKFCLGETWRKLNRQLCDVDKKKDRDASKPVAYDFNLPNPGSHNKTICVLSPYQGNTESH